MRSGAVRIPRDVAAHISKRRALRVVPFAVIAVALITVAVIFGKDIFGGAHPGLSWVLFAVVIIATARLLDIPFWLFDKTWAGRIIAKDEENYISPDDNRTVRTGNLQVNKAQRLKIELDSGKIIEHIIYDNRARHAFRDNAYNVGDRVIHVGGARYIQAVAVGDNDTLICVVCGAESRADDPECRVCGKTLKID